jgi:AcrR family transcriptional regulator
MKKLRKDAVETCQCLIDAASEIFAEKGYKDATVAEICKKAGTNVASVNYHFGNKERLYAEAWRCSFRKCLEKYPPDGGVSDGAPPEERLWGRVASLVHKILDKDHRAFSIMQKELAQPTGLLKDLVKKELQPIQEKMLALVRELIGPDASDRQVQSCKSSIIGQCFHLSMMKRAAKIHVLDSPINFNNVDALADHIVNFSLAGIKAVREEALVEKSGKN